MTALKGVATMDPLEESRLLVRRFSRHCGWHHIHSVERRDQGHLGTVHARLENVLVVVHGQDGTHQGAIVTVGTGTAESDEDTD